jgi:hypothetical protein
MNKCINLFISFLLFSPCGLLLLIMCTLFSAMPLFAAPGDVIERFSADWESGGWGLAYDTLKDRMLVYHDKPIQHLWQVEVDAPHTSSQFPLQNFAEAIENLTGGTVLPGNGDIYAVEWYNNSHGPTIARYDTGGDLQAFSSGCAPRGSSGSADTRAPRVGIIGPGPEA